MCRDTAGDGREHGTCQERLVTAELWTQHKWFVSFGAMSTSCGKTDTNWMKGRMSSNRAAGPPSVKATALSVAD